MDVELLQGEARRLDHVHAFVGDFERALGGDHEVQGLARRVVPAVAVVRLQCRRLDRWGLVALVEDQPVLRRVFQLLGHALGMEQPLLGEVAVQLRLAGPYRFAVEDGGEQHRVLQAGELVVLVGRLAADPDEAIAAVGIALVQRGLGAIADRLVVELELELGPAEALEVVPDQDRHRMADEHRHLARRQERIGRMRLGEDDAVLLQVGGGDDTVRLQFGAQPGKVVAFVDAVGANGLQQHGVALLLRPAGHVPGADIAGEHLVAADLGQGVVTETDLAVARHPALGGNGHLVLEQGSERLAAERRQGDTHAGDQPALEKGAPGYITVGHASSSGWYGSHPCRYSGLNSSSGRTKWSTQAENLTQELILATSRTRGKVRLPLEGPMDTRLWSPARPAPTFSCASLNLRFRQWQQPRGNHMLLSALLSKRPTPACPANPAPCSAIVPSSPSGWPASAPPAASRCSPWPSAGTSTN